MILGPVTQQRRRCAALAGAVVLAFAGVTGCSSDDDATGNDQHGLSGTLTVGTNAPFAPLEFRDQDDNLVGFDIDVANAVAGKLGVTAKFLQSPFPTLLTDVAAGKFDVVARGLFDTKERQEQVDMVTYYSAGTQWAGRTDAPVDPNNACGSRVGAEADTVQFTTELPAKSDACTDVGDPAIEIVPFENIDAAVTGLQNGDVDGISFDSPVIAYAAKNSDGKLATAGTPFDTLPYAFAVAKGSSLASALQEAVQELIDDGELATIAEKWGLQDGLITESLINGAAS